MEHNLALAWILKWAEDCGLTLNENKCQMNKKQVSYFGVSFTENGIHPDESKVKDLKNEKRP